MKLPLASSDVNGFLALVASLRRTSYMLPCTLLPPDFNTTLKTAPPVRLYSAEKAFVMV